MESQTRNTQLAIWEWTLQFLLCLLFLIPLISVVAPPQTVVTAKSRRVILLPAPRCLMQHQHCMHHWQSLDTSKMGGPDLMVFPNKKSQ